MYIASNSKCKFLPHDQVSPLNYCYLLFIISTHKLNVSRNFLSIRIVSAVFIWSAFSVLRNSQLMNQMFGVYVNLKLSNMCK